MTEPIEKLDQIHAPWTQEQVDALNDFQKLGFVHEFTCICGGHTVLVATPEGWICPKGCGYRQEWAWAFMADREDPIWTNPLDRMLKEVPKTESLMWERGGWTYRLIPEGHLWRFSGEFTYQDDKGETHVLRPDFGAIPGGAFVAIQDLVAFRSAAEPYMDALRDALCEADQVFKEVAEREHGS